MSAILDITVDNVNARVTEHLELQQELLRSEEFTLVLDSFIKRRRMAFFFFHSYSSERLCHQEAPLAR